VVLPPPRRRPDCNGRGGYCSDAPDCP
jgi:hypothetical protein